MPRFQVKQTEPLTKKVRIADPCVNMCTATCGLSVYCVGCHRHHLDVSRWNTYTEDEKIAAMWRATEHKRLKEQGVVTDHSEYSYTGDNKGFNIK